MSIKSAIIRSKDDLMPFETKSYANLNFDYELVELKNFFSDHNSEMVERIKEREYNVDKAEVCFKMFNANGGELITINQIRDIFDDLGFNVDVAFSETHGCDIALVYNVGGYLLPGWQLFSKIVSKFSPQNKNLMLTKLSPGIMRLHCRIYHSSDGAWFLLSHIDNANWMNIINPIQTVKSHLVKGTGDYISGTQIMMVVMGMVKEKFAKHENLFVDIEEIRKDIDKRKKEAK